MTAARRRLRAVQALIVGLLVALFSPTTSADAVPPSVVEVHAYAYDDPAVPVQAGVRVTERGPPAVTYDNTAAPAVSGHGARGAPARPERSSSWTRTTYDHPALLVEVARTSGTAERQPRVIDGDLSSLHLHGVAANAGRTGARTCLRSFAGTTLVLMADGTKKPIEDVKVGDKVIATDPETGERVIRKVTHVWVHSDQVLDLVVDGEVITTTEDHLFWSVTDQRFERADQLAAGEVVLGDGGRQLRVSGFRLGTARKTLAYNLEIAGVHTYHVGENEILVHNDCDPFEAARALRGADPEDVLDAIPDNWIVSDAPKALGGAMKFSNPANRSQIIIFERGTGRASDGLHGGPYLRLSSGRGGVQRIPLLGNPSLAVP